MSDISDLKTGDEVEVFGQRGYVNRVKREGEVEVQDADQLPRWRGWFMPTLLTKIEPPPPQPQIGEIWEHVSGEDRLFFINAPAAGLWYVNVHGEQRCWDDVRDKHYYSKVEA